MPRGHRAGTPKPGGGWGIGKSPHEGEGAGPAGESQSQTKLKTRCQAEWQMNQRQPGPSSQDACWGSGSPQGLGQALCIVAQHGTATEAGSVTTLMETLSYLEGRMKDTSGFSVTKLEGLVQCTCWVVGEDPGSGMEDRGGEQTEISLGVGGQVPADGDLLMPE